MAWLTGYNKRWPLVVNGAVPGLSASVTAPLIEALPAGLLAVAKADLSDLRITAADGVTLLPFGIESVTAGVVHLLGAFATGLTTVYAYAGKADAVSVEDKAATAAGNAVYFPLGDTASPVVDWVAGLQGAQVGTPDCGQTGKCNGAPNLSGSGEYFDCGDASALDFGTSDFSVMAWVKRTNANVNGDILDKRQLISSVAVGFLLGAQNDSAGNVANMAVAGNGGASINCLGTSPIEAGVWHHIAGTADRDGNGSIYVNGTFEQATDISSQNGKSISNANKACIGYHDPILSSAMTYWNGLVDQLVGKAGLFSADDIKFAALSYPGSAMCAWGAMETRGGGSLFQFRNLGNDRLFPAGGLLKGARR